MTFEQELGTDIPIIDLFPYRMKNRELYYHRNHPEGVSPFSQDYVDYWDPFWDKCVEGHWVYDHYDHEPENGSWVWLSGKLFRYLNYAKVKDSNKDPIFPDLRVNEFLFAYYFECADGFSGFELDELYTAHRTIERLEKTPDDVMQYEIDRLPPEVYKPDGSFKKFVHPWEYLTRNYLVDAPVGKSLGRALYHNGIKNRMIGSCRGSAKSYTVFAMDLEHKIQFCDINRVEDAYKVNRPKMIALGCHASKQLERSMEVLKNSYYDAPGQYMVTEEESPTGKEYLDKGPLFKKLQGSWEVGGQLKHIIKSNPSTPEVMGVTIQSVVMTPDKLTVGAGDRMDVYIEEAFFQPHLLTVHANLNDTVSVDGKQVARITYLGTGGNIANIRDSFTMYTNPGGYNIFGIPDYWGKSRKEIGLFIPKLYAQDDARDENGNVDLQLAFEITLRQRKKKFEESDSVSYNMEVQFNPLTPMEMLQPSGQTLLPKKEAQRQLIKLDNSGEYKRRIQIGELRFNPTKARGVEWERDLSGTLQPVTDIKSDDQYVTKHGATCIYEQPNSYIPENLYWVVYDPAAKAGDGESFHAAIVYKWHYFGASEALSDTIVGEWIGRRMKLEDNYKEVIKLALYFNARIFVETNVAGFVDYCSSNNYYYLLEPDAYLLEKEINPNHKRGHYKVGINLTTRTKMWAEKKLPGWLREVRDEDPNTGLPTKTTMDTIMSKRALHEIVAHTPSGNYDVYSCLILLMVLIHKIEDLPKPNTDDPEENPTHVDYMLQNQGHRLPKKRKRTRPKILNY